MKEPFGGLILNVAFRLHVLSWALIQSSMS